ncbi:MAG: hypothetical protein NZ742_09440 [Acidobacteria bacterium]|nr:hypothetical protein [Acidobacteriota bacterium]MDW7985009.1 hypothetical protein [Acidobacteriota bacterium]
MRRWALLRTRLGIIVELFGFLGSHKLWRLIPMTVTLLPSLY